MRSHKHRFTRLWIIGLCLLFAFTAGCGRDKKNADNTQPPEVIQPYTGPCPEGQSSWDCMAWNQSDWE